MKAPTHLLSISLFTLLCIQEGITQGKSTIHGQIEAMESGRAFLFEALTRDTLAISDIVNYRFTLISKKGETSGQALPSMINCLRKDGKHSTSAPIALENADISISISSTGFSTYSGTVWQTMYSTFMTDLFKVAEQTATAQQEIQRDSLQGLMAVKVEDFFMETRKTPLQSFASLIVSDMISRKFVAPDDLPRIKARCVENNTTDTLEKNICDAILLYNSTWVGKNAPQIEGRNLDGELIKLHDILGRKPVIIDFWASWCGPCIKEMPDLKSLYAEGKVEILGVSIDDRKDAWLKSVERLNLPWLNIWDEGKSISKLFNVIAVPSKFVINKEGIIISQNPEDLSAVLRSMD